MLGSVLLDDGNYYTGPFPTAGRGPVFLSSIGLLKVKAVAYELLLNLFRRKTYD
jgi:hypothetical protein